MEQTIEQTSKNTSVKGYKAVSIVGIVVTVAFIAFYIAVVAFLSASVGSMMPIELAIQQFYQSNGFVMLLLLVLWVGLFKVKNNRENFAKILIWAILLLSAVHSSVFFGYLESATQLPPISILDVASMYVPVLCGVAALVAMLAGWEMINKSKVVRVAKVCTVIAVLFTVYYLIRMFTSVEITMAQLLQLSFPACSSIAVTLISVFVIVVCKTRRGFDKTICGMTDEEAAVIEEAEDSVEEVVENFEAKLGKNPKEVSAFIEEMITEKVEEEPASVMEEVKEAAEDIAEDMEKADGEILNKEKD